MQKVLTGLIGFASGSLVAGGVVALMVGLGIITRFIGISHTARHAKIYETFICMGGIAGNLVTVYFPHTFSGLAWTLASWTVLRHFCGRLDHGAGRAAECLPGLYPPSEPDERNQLDRSEPCSGENSGKSDAILQGMVKL